ncbi:TonB-dependent receptor [Croceicoccus sp. Ery5]|uniref:TonB-dependent receptor n=1 Tax=Croceicoccus sp. Ery5 TaxID=1703340 RepID=UPI001E559C3F|nr:TonB-dependent receptor [Croceicoccus sp. Ery5]
MKFHRNSNAKSKALAAASVLGLVMGAAAPAYAQDAEAADEQAGTASAGDIIVTARAREEKLIDIPVAVSAFSQESLQQADIANPVELSNYVPGLDFQQAAAGTDSPGSNPNITFRGIRQQLSSASNQVGAIFYDGSFLGAGAGILTLEDLERVEVIKGPQTAYFGRNTFAGAVNYIPAQASDYTEMNGELMYSPSDDDSFKIALAAGTPLGDRAGLRFNFVRARSGGDFEYGDGEALNRQDKTQVGATFTVEPVDNLNLKFSGYYVDATDTYLNVSIDSTVPAGECDRTVSGEYINTATGERTPFTTDLSQLPYGSFCGHFPEGKDSNILTPISLYPTAENSVGGDPSASYEGNALMDGLSLLPDMPGRFGGHHKTWRGQMNGDYTFDSGHSVSWIASRTMFGSSYSFDQYFGLSADGSVLPRGYQTWIKETYAEARFASPQEQAFRYMFGATHYKQDYRNGATGPVLTVNFQDTKSFSLFGAVDLDLTDTLTISGEGRWVHDKLFVDINGDPTLPTDSPSVTYQSGNSMKKFMPRAIVTWKPALDTTIYASWSRSALIGEQTNAAVVHGLDPELIPDPDAFGDFTPPQTNTSYELGWKQQLDWATFSLAGFYMKWDNQVFRTTVLAGTQTTSYALPGASEYKGIEFEGFATPTDWLNIGAGLLWVDAELLDYAARSSFESAVLGSGTLAVVSDGYRPKGVSEWSGNLNLTVHGDVAGHESYVRSDFLYRGSFYAENQEFNKIDGALKINLRAGTDLAEGLTFELYGKNITDNRQLDPIAFTTSGPNGRKIFTPPTIARELGARLMFNF